MGDFTFSQVCRHESVVCWYMYRLKPEAVGLTYKNNVRSDSNFSNREFRYVRHCNLHFTLKAWGAELVHSV
jgi:hypothetical protein